MTNLLCPWPDVPKQEKAERKIRTVRMLRRVRLDDGRRVAEVGDIERFPHPLALHMVRNKQAVPA